MTCIAWSCWCTIKELLDTMEWSLLWLKYFEPSFLRHLIAMCFLYRAPRVWWNSHQQSVATLLSLLEWRWLVDYTQLWWPDIQCGKYCCEPLPFLTRTQTYFTVSIKRKYQYKTVKTTTIYNVTFKMSQVNWRSVSSSSSHSFVTVQ